MSRNTKANTNDNKPEMTPEQVYALILEQERSEYGFARFQNPRAQADFAGKEEEYRLMYSLKDAYDGQEMLRKMRADIKREYLTRKNQVKKLQMRAAVTFRNAESKLQEHYTSTPPYDLSSYQRAVDIEAPLVDVVELPDDNSFNVKEFDFAKGFEKLREAHASICHEERECIMQAMRDQREQEEQERQRQQQHHQEDPHEIPWAEWVASGQASETCLGCNNLECSDCYDSDSDGDSDGDSYDSDYCGVFGYYPREYEYERQAREEEEARVAQAARLRAEHEAEAAAEEAERGKIWDDMTLEEEERIWLENTRDVNAPWSDNDDNDNDDNDDDNDATEVVTVPEVAASGTGGIICAKKKAVAAAGAAKARREKQQRKKDAAKFVPFKITMNTNRENATEQVLYVGRAQINHAKKRNVSQVVARTEDEARKAKNRDAAKWKRLNGDLKQTAARGTKVATLPDPKTWYNNNSWCCYDSDN